MAKEFLELMKEGETIGPNLAAQAKGISDFNEKLDSFVNLITNEAGHSRNKYQYLMREAETTSDFPLLFASVIERTLLAKYQIAKPDWRAYVKVGTQNDFRKANAFGIFGLQSSLGVVKERGEYPADKLADGSFSITLSKYGRKFPLSWEALMNDDLGAFSDAADRLANAALRTEFNVATKLFVSAGGPNTTLFQASGTHPIDGTSFSNLGTLSLTGDNLAAVITKMKQQKDADGEPIIITRFHVVVPVALEYKLAQILSQNLLIATALGSTSAAATQTSENIIAKYPITSHTNPYLDIIDTTHPAFTWYVFADINQDGAALGMNFLRGHENPEIVQRQSDKVSLGGGSVSPLEGDFDSDSVNWRVRHIMGGTQLDPRFAYANNPAS